jgi:hypothetical protein
MMQDWNSLKELVAAWSGLDRSALHIFAGTLAHVAIASILRRRLFDDLPWLLVLAVGVGNEAMSALADHRLESWEIRNGARDLLLVMAIPTLLLLLSRHSRLFAARPRPPRLHFDIRPPVEDRIIDVEYEEISSR